MRDTFALPTYLVLDASLKQWLLEDMGRGDRTTQAILTGSGPVGKAQWFAKEQGVIAGLPIAERVFSLINGAGSQAQVVFSAIVEEGALCDRGQQIATIEGPMDILLTGERVALNLAMRLSGIATMTHTYVERIKDLPAKLVDTRKTTPGLRILEKYASQVGGAINHRMGLDDAVMIKDNHIAAAGSIEQAVALVRKHSPYPLSIEVETESLEMVRAAMNQAVDIIMLDNMPITMMTEAVQMIREAKPQTKIEASGNVTLETIRAIAETGVDYISSSAPITRSPWLDLSMKLV